MPVLQVQIQGHERVQRKLASVELTEKQMNFVIAGAEAFALADIRSEARDLGAIGRSFVAEPMGELGARVGSRHPGARAVDLGRRAGSKMPPTAALEVWADAHGLTGLEFPIARAIARRGIKGRFFTRRTRERLREHEIPKLIDEAKRRIAAFWSSR